MALYTLCCFLLLLYSSVLAKKGDVIDITDGSWRDILQGEWMIKFCKDGIFRKYQGSRTHKDFINFVNEKEWESIEPVSSWFSPDSLLMSGMSTLFQLSVWIRYCHNYFVEDIGLPVWGSYILFGLMTLFLGLVLGLVSCSYTP
ncbi:hypothetical protein GDO78_010389 [Eleutherodactylus coqui]|uniref:Uncharacterized protein n=1 Tax=Eleutherodactylus coqui TaxID=57060 RepID=A0A8J6F3Q9_ELECQ|nr:hypothetical protein GDO78_010389 [Eleutherodactylus coqui]